ALELVLLGGLVDDVDQTVGEFQLGLLVEVAVLGYGMRRAIGAFEGAARPVGAGRRFDRIHIVVGGELDVFAVGRDAGRGENAGVAAIGDQYPSLFRHVWSSIEF